MIARSIHCMGKVQGVYYRASTKEVARDLGLYGWVKNQADGSVLIHVEGQEEAINQLVSWCKQGPRFAEVEAVEVIEAEVEGYTTFDISR